MDQVDPFTTLSVAVAHFSIRVFSSSKKESEEGWSEPEWIKDAVTVPLPEIVGRTPPVPCLKGFVIR